MVQIFLHPSLYGLHCTYQAGRLRSKGHFNGALTFSPFWWSWGDLSEDAAASWWGIIEACLPTVGSMGRCVRCSGGKSIPRGSSLLPQDHHFGKKAAELSSVTIKWHLVSSESALLTMSRSEERVPERPCNFSIILFGLIGWNGCEKMIWSLF